MPTLLHINVSPRGDYSISRQLGNAAVEAWKARNPGGRVIERGLARTPLTFVDLDWIAGASPPEHHNENHKKALALSDELVAEVLTADEIIVATPLPLSQSCLRSPRFLKSSANPKHTSA